MHKKYVVKLREEERQLLTKLVSTGKTSARKLTRAHILLKADGGLGNRQWTDHQISEAFNVSAATIQRIRQQFVEGGLDAALSRRQQRQYERKLEGEPEAYLEQLIYHNPPEGQDEWTVRTLTERVVEMGFVDSISEETVRKTVRNIWKKLKEKGIALR